MVLTAIRKALAGAIAPKDTTISKGSVISQEEGVRKEIGLKTWNQRRQDMEEFIIGFAKKTTTTDKTGKPKTDIEYNELGTSSLNRIMFKASMGMGQLGSRQPITGRNATAWRDLGLWCESFLKHTKGDESRALVYEELAHAAGLNLVNRSVYSRDADVQVARLEPQTHDWKSNRDDLSKG